MDSPKILLTAVLIVACTSCSVREDRSGCPCILTLDVSDCPRFGADLSIKVWSDGEENFSGIIRSAEHPSGWSCRTGRNTAEYFACIPLGTMVSDRHSIKTAPGNQADSIFAYGKILSTRDETVLDKVFLHKHHMQLDVVFAKDGTGRSGVGQVSVNADFNGLSLPSMEPLEGEYSFKTVPEEGRCRIRLPRQGDGSITMDVTAEDGSSLATVDVGSLLDKAGYSWDSVDLADVELDLSEIEVGIAITVTGWEDGVSYSEFI